MAITTVADLNGLYNLIYEDALFVAREMNLMTNLVRNFSASGYMARKVGIRPTITAQDKPEGVDFQNPTLFDKQLKATLTPKTVMAQVLLTDEDVATDPDDARTDAATELGGAVATKIDSDLAQLFNLATKEKGGGSGVALSIGKCSAAVSVLRNAHSPNPLYFVLHPYGWQDIWTELGQPASNKAFLGDLANEAMNSYFVGSWIAATWFTSTNVYISGTDAVSGVFNPQALGFDTRQAPEMEPERDASRKATEMNLSAGYAVGILRQEYLVKLTHDITEPA